MTLGMLFAGEFLCPRCVSLQISQLFPRPPSLACDLCSCLCLSDYLPLELSRDLLAYTVLSFVISVPHRKERTS